MSFITADQLLAHAIGDYIIQSHWMATEKTKNNFAAFLHAISYALPFLFLRPSYAALAIIVITHFIIDRWRLARLLVTYKNALTDFSSEHTYKPFWTPTGYPADTPPWLAFWLLIIADNIMHAVINGLALRYL